MPRAQMRLLGPTNPQTLQAQLGSLDALRLVGDLDTATQWAKDVLAAGTKDISDAATANLCLARVFSEKQVVSAALSTWAREECPPRRTRPLRSATTKPR